MKYSLLGSSQLKVSRIGFGCMSLPSDESLAIPIIQQAIDYGINYFDTADIYQDGRNEEILGKTVHTKRDKVIIATKAGNVRRPDGGLDWNPSGQHIIDSVEGSLRRLHTDYIDLYQLHGGTINDNIDETIAAFEMLRQQGKILYYGISSIRPNVIAEYVKRSSIISVMMQYSLLDRRPEESCLDLLHEHRISVVARGSLAQGLLLDKPAKTYLELTTEQVRQAAATVKNISNGRRPASHTAILYTLNHPAVASAVTGIRTSEQLLDLIGIFDSPQLTAEEIQELKNTVPALTYKEHRV